MRAHRLLSLMLVLAAFPGAVAARPPSVAVAAAANLTYVIEALNREFRLGAPEVNVTTTLSSSGNLSAQIRNGAPFDVFLSADTEYPRALAAAGYGDPATLQIFAIGRLAFWTVREDIDPAHIAAVVRSPSVKKLAIAQPRTAPYGRAARAVLQSLGVWSEAAPKLVIGENIAQTAQFVETGNADAGFVALSFVLAPPLARRGRYAPVATELFAGVSLEHACLVTKRGRDNPAARQYLAFLRSAPARRILERHGYAVPADP